jgi:hypothetical protein
VATTASTAVVRVKGGAFCSSGEIPSAAAVKDVAGSMSRRLREASQQLSQQLSEVSRAGLRCLLFPWGLWSHVFLSGTDFADRVASGALNADVAAEIKRLRAQHTDAVWEKSVAESKNRRLAEKVAALEAEKTDLRHQLVEERREANQAIAEAQTTQAEAKVAWAEGSLASQRAEEWEVRFNALHGRVDKAEASTRSEVERTLAQRNLFEGEELRIMLFNYREMGIIPKVEPM